MQNYQDFLKHILDNGIKKTDRTQTGVISTFGYQMRFDLAKGFPLVTTKKIHLKSVVHELLWFLRGDTNIEYLQNNGVSIWNEWADKNGDLGPVYGHQWRSWKTADGNSIDQLSQLMEEIKKNPHSRRLLVSSWNVGELEKMALPPCHLLFQFYVANGKLSCLLFQRSADAFLGVPFNIASYSLLTHMVAQQCGLEVNEFICTFGDCHIYLDHLDAVQTQLRREPFSSPQLRINRKPTSIFDYTFDDFEFLNYQYHPAIKAMVSV
jgi:thymidylate synthase